MYASEAKKSEFLVHLDTFSNIILSQVRLFLDKIDLLSLHVLYSLQFKIGVHLLKVELTQLLTLSATMNDAELQHCKVWQLSC